MLGPDHIDEAFCGAVTVGERGQVVIPASAREKIGVSPGDRLLVFVHPDGHGVAFVKLQALQRASEAIAPFLQGDLVTVDEEEPAVAAPGGESA